MSLNEAKKEEFEPVQHVGLDPALLSKVKAGDANAFQEFYEETSGDIFRYIFHHLPNSDYGAAEDILQEVYSLFFRRLPELKVGEDIVSWLYTVAKNLLANYARLAYQRKRQGFLDYLHDELVDNATDLQSAFEANEEITTVLRSVIQSLNIEEQNRNIALALFVEHASVNDICERFSVTPNAVYLLRHRSIKQLRAIFAENEKLRERINITCAECTSHNTEETSVAPTMPISNTRMHPMAA